MKKLSAFYDSLSTGGKIAMIVAFICCLGPVGLIIMVIVSNKGDSDRFEAVLNNPTEENLNIMMEKMGGISNHPDNWNQYRGLWNVVNRSNKITTSTKEKFLAKLMGCGLHINNTKVIDNYKG